MPDEALVHSVLHRMLLAAHTILRRFAPINAAADFRASDEGLDRLDAICMQLIVMGESTKNLDKITGGQLLPRYPTIEWRRIMGMRDILSHHYFDLDEEVVYNVCTYQVPRLVETLERMLKDIGP